VSQPDIIVVPAASAESASKQGKASDLWIAGAVVLGVVFLPALIAGVMSLLIR
jgi:hypothetical protein